jgi:hypothetical protein
MIKRKKKRDCVDIGPEMLPVRVITFQICTPKKVFKVASVLQLKFSDKPVSSITSENRQKKKFLPLQNADGWP